MICTLLTGRLVKHPTLDDRGRYIATLAGFDNSDQPCRLHCRRKAHVQQLSDLPKGSPVSVSGRLKITPIISGNGEPRALLMLEVSSVVTPEAPKSLLGRLVRAKA